MILPIYVYGQPVLRKVAEDITPEYPNLKELIANMFETMVHADGVGVKYMDENFVEHDEVVEGYLARVMQHEFDHLDGKMFIDHLSPLRKQMIRGKLNTMLKGKARSSYKMKQVK